MLSTVNDYENAHSKLKIKCSNNHEFSISSSNINNKKWCPNCNNKKNNITEKKEDKLIKMNHYLIKLD